MAEKGFGKYNCTQCSYVTTRLQNWEKHLQTAKHLKTGLGEQGLESVIEKYTCDKCEYATNKSDHWNRHILTTKHATGNGCVSYACDKCEYTTNKSDHWNRHVLTNKHTERRSDENPPGRPIDVFAQFNNGTSTDDIMQFLLRENVDLKQLIHRVVEQNAELNRVVEQNTVVLTTAIESMNKPTSAFVNNTTNNNSFNINVFLNEKCANAKNMSDFIAGIEITHEDLENNAELGFVGGMVKIITDNLNKLDITERPIHCTDSKRDILYIKDDNKWSKEGSFDKMNKYIQEISGKNVRKLLKWKRENPDYADGDSEFSIKSLKIHMTLMAGAERDKFYPRVIHEVSKLSIIDKNTM